MGSPVRGLRRRRLAQSSKNGAATRKPLEPDPGHSGVGRNSAARLPHPSAPRRRPDLRVYEGDSPMPDGTQKFTVSTGPLPASRKIHVAGTVHPDLRVAMREIDLTPSANEPAVRVYDASGPYTDPNVGIDITRGLATLRGPWIRARGDVEDYDGRTIKPEDNGRKVGDKSDLLEFALNGKKPLRAKAGRAVTQL